MNPLVNNEACLCAVAMGLTLSLKLWRKQPETGRRGLFTFAPYAERKNKVISQKLCCRVY